MIENALLTAVLGICTGLLLIVSDWRVSLGLVSVCMGLSRLLEWREIHAFVAGATSVVSLLTGIAIIAAVCVALIVLFTGLTYNRAYDFTPTDEVEAMEWRRSMRQAARPDVAQGWDAYRMPVLALILFIIGVFLVPLFYPSPAQASDYAWTILLLGGVLTVAVSDTLLKLGMGVLVICVGLKLCYVRLAAQIGMFDLVLFDIVPIVMAVLLALLSNVLFTRLGTLRLTTLFEQAHPAPQPTSAAQHTNRSDKSDML